MARVSYQSWLDGPRWLFQTPKNLLKKLAITSNVELQTTTDTHGFRETVYYTVSGTTNDVNNFRARLRRAIENE